MILGFGPNREKNMDAFLTFMFYMYAGLIISAPILVVPAIFICRKASASWSKGLLMLIPIVGIPLFFRALVNSTAATN